jgi:hypothetical protein
MAEYLSFIIFMILIEFCFNYQYVNIKLIQIFKLKMTKNGFLSNCFTMFFDNFGFHMLKIFLSYKYAIEHLIIDWLASQQRQPRLV